MNSTVGRTAAVLTTVLACIGLTAVPASGANQPEPYAAPAPANSVTSSSIVNGQVYQQDINPAVVNVLRTPAGGSVNSWTIKDGSIEGRDLSLTTKKVLMHTPKDDVTTGQVRDSSLYLADLEPRLRAMITGERVSSLSTYSPIQVSGPDGVDHSSERWSALESAQTEPIVQRTWVKCPTGTVALGGGHSRWTESPKLFRLLNIVTSAPAVIQNGQVVSVENGTMQAVPNGWVIEGFYETPDGMNARDLPDLVVRAWVTCAKVG